MLTDAFSVRADVEFFQSGSERRRYRQRCFGRRNRPVQGYAASGIEEDLSVRQLKTWRDPQLFALQ